jgi:hypothetical protein
MLNVAAPSGIHTTDVAVGVIDTICGADDAVLNDMLIFPADNANAGTLLSASRHKTATTVAAIFEEMFIVSSHVSFVFQVLWVGLQPGYW